MEDLIPELHLPFANFVQLGHLEGTHQRKTEWMPRGHFKSSITSVAYPLWILIHDRNTSIALISAVEKNTKKWLDEMRNTIQYNTFFQWAFGDDIQPGDKWDQNAFTIQRDRELGINTQPSVVAYTIRGGLASAHHPHIILDDPLNEKTAFSDVERERAIELYVHLTHIGMKYGNTREMLVGTPWPGYDVIQHSMENEVKYGTREQWGIGAKGGFTSTVADTHPEVVPDLDERLARDGVIFTEVCPLEKLESVKRQDLNQYIYQLLCSRPEDTDNGFDVKLIRDFAMEMDGGLPCSCHDHTHHLQDLVLCAICDPALSTDPTACESAITVVGRAPKCGCRFTFYEWGGRVHSIELVDKMCEVATKWQTYLRRFAIEDVHFQSVFKSFLIERKADGRFPLDVEVFGVKPQKRDKDLRIAGQQSYVANGYWHKRPDMYYDESRENLLWQLKKWPDQPKKRDRIDSWAYCDDVWEDLSPARVDDINERENPLRARNTRNMKNTLDRMRKASEA